MVAVVAPVAVPVVVALAGWVALVVGFAAALGDIERDGVL